MKSAGCLLLLLRSTSSKQHTSLAFVPRSARCALAGLHATKSPNYIPQGANEWGIPESGVLPPLQESTPPQICLANGGRVTLVGSGPGDPDLLTLAAHRLLQDPDAFVIADRLVSEEILSVIKGDVKVARKLPGCAELAQEEIYWLAYQGLCQGKHVVRLKIGDPFVFGRGGEEVLTFRRFGVEPTVIPVRTDSLYEDCLVLNGIQHSGSVVLTNQSHSVLFSTRVYRLLSQLLFWARFP